MGITNYEGQRFYRFSREEIHAIFSFGTREQAIEWETKACGFEREGLILQSIKIYWKLVGAKFEGSFPYRRLRVLHGKRKEWEKAIQACQAYIDLHAQYLGFDRKAWKMGLWIEKYRAFL